MPTITPLSQSTNVDKATRLAWQWNNILLEKQRAVTVKIPSIQTPFQVKITSWPQKNIPSRYIGVVFTMKSITSILWLSNWPLLNILKNYAPKGNVKKIPKSLQTELIETVFEPVINFFEQQLNQEIKIQQLLFNTAFKSNQYSVKFQILENNKIITAILVSNTKLAPIFLKRIGILPRLPNAAWLEHKTIVHIEVASIFLSINDIKQLTLSDILFVEESIYFQNHTLFLRLSSGERFKAKQTSGTTLEFLSGEKIMPESSNDQMKEKPIVNINDMPIRLSFDLGEESLTFKEVTNLRPGYILNLKKPFTNVIKIRSQNQLIGQGEIIDIDGKVGVRITQLFNKKS